MPQSNCQSNPTCIPNRTIIEDQSRECTFPPKHGPKSFCPVIAETVG